MFTGIVEEIGIVTNKTKNLLKVTTSANLMNTNLGESISVSGVCLTIVEKTRSGFAVDLSEETLKKTNLNSLVKGDKVNLERALTPESRMGGHFVQGHVDDVGLVTAISGSPIDRMVKVKNPPNLSPYIVQKGFIAVNGVSLTVVSAKESEFDFTLIPFSAENTNLGSLTAGDRVNLEVDIMAKYVESIIERKRDT